MPSARIDMIRIFTTISSLESLAPYLFQSAFAAAIQQSLSYWAPSYYEECSVHSARAAKSASDKSSLQCAGSLPSAQSVMRDNSARETEKKVEAVTQICRCMPEALTRNSAAPKIHLSSAPVAQLDRAMAYGSK